MQPPLAPPRDHLTAAQVIDLLRSPALRVEMGAELLDVNLNFVEDISDDLAGGKVERNLTATIHGTCDLSLSRELKWGVDLVRPYMTLTAGGVSARWNVGAFAMVTPDRQVGETPQTWDVQGYDRLMLLDREVGADYTVTSGTTYRQALLDVFSDAGLAGVYIDGTAADDTLPSTRDWPLVATDEADADQTDTPVTWLRIVNDLCRQISFRAVWADHNGTFRCGAYQPPADRGSEFTFDTDDQDTTIVGQDRTVVEDVWGSPNRWVFRQSNRPDGAPAPTEGDGIYVVDESDTVDGDWLGRTLVWTSVVDYEAASQAKLQALGDRRVAADRRVTAKVKLETGPFPAAGHADIIRLVDSAIGNWKMQATGWVLPLDGGNTEWELERIA